jgi:hypothetical protein
VIPSARVIGGNSATTTIRPAPHRGQTRVGVTAASRPGGGTGSGSLSPTLDGHRKRLVERILGQVEVPHESYE